VIRPSDQGTAYRAAGYSKYLWRVSGGFYEDSLRVKLPQLTVRSQRIASGNLPPVMPGSGATGGRLIVQYNANLRPLNQPDPSHPTCSTKRYRTRAAGTICICYTGHDKVFPTWTMGRGDDGTSETQSHDGWYVTRILAHER